MSILLALACALLGFARAATDYPLGPGDELAITVIGEDAMSGQFRIAPDGSVSIPFAGPIGVDGLTIDEATTALAAHLSRTVLKRPQLVATIAVYRSREIEVAGAVAKPGTYPATSRVATVRDMLVAAGGLVDISAPRAEIHRDVAGERRVVEVDLERLFNGDVAADFELRGGDRLYVPPAESVFVDGQVAKPGAIAYRDGMTLMQAIAQAGSTLSTARAAGVYILRGTEKIPVNVRRIQRGDDADVALRPSDRVYVPESAF